MAKTKLSNVVEFPAQMSHRVDTGGACLMEIKHSHPTHPSEEERVTQLKDLQRVCLALVRKQQDKANEEESA